MALCLSFLSNSCKSELINGLITEYKTDNIKKKKKEGNTETKIMSL